MQAKKLNVNWKIKEVADETEINFLAESLSISHVLAKLLVFRNIKNFDQAKSFFRTSLDNLHDPFLMEDMEKATTRVIEALTNNERILIYGDYDVDGTCATALLYMFLKELNADVDYYIPHRIKEGYGLTKVGVDYAKENNFHLIISVDCGVTARDEADYANELGIDLIICDHHKPKEILPAAFALLDPLKPNCNYPFKYLSGAGVAFKLAQGICKTIGKNDLLFQYLDLVALAGAADIVPLIDENRTLVKAGLDLMNSSPRAGIKALIKSARVELGNLSSGQIVFTLAPRINAVGRLSDAKIAVKLLISKDENESLELAKQLETENIERRKIDEGTLNKAIDLVETSRLFECEAIILHEEDWHPGVIGIVASRLVERYYKPTIMLTTIDGVAKGSARSISNFNIYDALRECQDLLLHFGGHEAAAGVAVEIKNLEEFKTKFNEVVKSRLLDKDKLYEIIIDSKIRLTEIDAKFIRIMDQFSPFGPGNLRPTFLAENVTASSYRIVGNNHLLMLLRQEDSNKNFDAIGFDLGRFAKSLNGNKTTFDVVFSIDKMSREGKVFPQLRIKDIKIHPN
ncbi:MAG: single-stranded-DNA-specific exonuclease RecJ [Chlorobiaceae bacterium]|nr:single-stranded-DNA-specific exonuclease RecJ [Chlorobiaceae bacterium]MBA4309488.1 single-stranded-DNA-specific exonuclease RecJ [Chlorobiaceae bacterium]